MNEATPLWHSPASSVASVAGSIVRDGTAEPARQSRRVHNNGILPTTMTPRMIRIATVAGLLVAVSYYIIGGAMLSTTVQGAVMSGAQGVDVATTETTTAAAASLREVDHAEVKESRTEGVPDDSVLFLPGFGAPREKQYAGLVGVNSFNAGKLFYWFFETRAPMQIDDRTPLLLWLNGGPARRYRRHPEYKHNPLYVCGESYAGKYAPSVSHYIHVKNSGPPDNDDVVINLTGVAIGNGDMWPVLQTRSVPDFAIALGLIDSQQYEDANAQISVCEELHRQGRDVDAFQSSNTFTDLSTLLSSYFNDDAVRRALNVPPGTPWTSVDGSVYGTSSSAPALVSHLLQDEMLDVPINVFRDLLDNYKFLFYAGNMDGSLCNNLGVGRIIDRLAWTDTAKYRVAKRQPWMVDGQVAGLAKSAGNMSYVVVLNSGHLVPADQPEASLDMMRRFVNNEPFFTLSP
ncbi:hypothetical protein PC116_g22737 [Phytophthora cactorum]|nr:hypothetical protein PC111_g17825 [Phytophthora cactorum]KAG3164390.1 hypothetical protein C6341_g12686 [Phytophthora cactorum]KAG4228925.1 hypothetical protein PC116_g22737 [Phytophthora cactorum]